MPFAVGDQNHHATLQIATASDMTQSGLSTLGKRPTRFHPTGSIVVPVVTLDWLFHHRTMKPIGAIKIDTEGYETQVLQGSTNVISTHRLIIQAEYNEQNARQCDNDPKWIQNFVQLHRYRIQSIVDEEALMLPLL